MLGKSMSQTVKVLFFGDVVGAPGRMMFQKYAPKLKTQFSADAIIVNGENSNFNGRGITSKIVKFFKHNGADAVTTGNHVWDHDDAQAYFDTHEDMVRPANFPDECPGKGWYIFHAAGLNIGIINIQGRVFMRENLSCPFKKADEIVAEVRKKTNIIFVDFHAETTAEKAALAYHLDGRISGFVGTHTHVQTADERILPRGTAFITDLGMAGALHSSLGMKLGPIISRFQVQMPHRFAVETESPFMTSGVCIEVDRKTGKGISIERFNIVDEEIVLVD